MARKKKQPAEPTQSAQEVQENTIDDTSIDKGFGIAQAAFLMSRAAKRYNKPAEEITLKEALEMVKKDPAELPNKDDADIKEALGLTIRTAEELTGKPAAEITGADINKVLGENPPFVVSDETATAISNAADMAGAAQRIYSAIANTINNVYHSAEFQAISQAVKVAGNVTAWFAQNSAEIAEISHKAEEFNREILPFIVLEVADRTGERIIDANTGNAEPFSLEEIRAFLAEGETPDKEKSPFESEISRVLDLFSFDGKPATDEARELLGAANKRKATYTENIEVVGDITDIAESIEQAPDTEKAEIIKRELPARIKNLQEISAVVLDRKPTGLNKPTDKVNTEITQPLIKDNLLKTGQQRFAMIKDSAGRGVPVTLGVTFNLDELKKAGISANITAYDITMQQAIHTIYKTAYENGTNIGEHGEVYTTPNQIWAQMGSKNKLKTDSQRKKFYNALHKNNTTTCDIEASRLLNQYSIDGESRSKEVKVKERYYGTFITVRSYRGVIDGNERELIIIFSDPILTTFAVDLGQITEIPLYVIQATGTLNDDNLAISNYLQHEIVFMKRGERNTTINLKTLKEKTGTIKRDRNLEKYIEELLNEYKTPPKGETPFINGWEKAKTGYKIKLGNPIKGKIPQKNTRTPKEKP